MKTLIYIFCLISFGSMAQTEKVIEIVKLNGQNQLDLEFSFADNIVFEVWEKNEVMVEVDVNINNGEDNDIFALNSTETNSTVNIILDKSKWKSSNRKNSNCNNWNTQLDYKVYLPKNMKLKAYTISGDFTFAYYGSEVRLTTVSGSIDMTVKPEHALDFKAKTVTGEVYSDVEISYPYGKDGLRQIVGQNVHGRIKNGGETSDFETVSGDIYLRKG